MYRAEIIDHWQFIDGRNVSQLTIDHPLSAGASLVDTAGTPALNLVPAPNSRTSQVENVPLAWLDAVAADANYYIIWQEEIV